jgi:nucleotide-binding universal stress UspA family protein
VVGVESEEGKELLDVLADLGRAAPAQATVVHAVTAPAEGLMYYAGIDSEAMEDYRANVAREARARLTAAIAAGGIPTDIRIVDAAPASAIAEVAKDARSDLVVVSSHPRRAMARGILGSVSSGLIRHGATDLLIVPRLVSGSRWP